MKMRIQTLAVLAVVLAGLCGGAQSAEKVQLGFYSESLCPDCIDFANGPLEKAMNEVQKRGSITYCNVSAVAPDWQYLHTELRPLG
jgi:hypothetical protein